MKWPERDISCLSAATRANMHDHRKSVPSSSSSSPWGLLSLVLVCVSHLASPRGGAHHGAEFQKVVALLPFSSASFTL